MAFTFVIPSTVRIELSDGDWIEVKRELTAGELKAMRSSSFTYMQGTASDNADVANDVKLGVDWRKLGLAKVLAYVVDWNAKDAQGRPVPFSREAVESLSLTDFERLENAIAAHEKAQAEEKNAKAGATK